jgi:hypothetical protein
MASNSTSTANGSAAAAPAIDYSPVIFLFNLVLGGIAASFINFHGKRSLQPFAYFYSVSICCVVAYDICYLLSFLYPDPQVISNVMTTMSVLDMVTSVCLETCYILRLKACLVLYNRRWLANMLWIFPAVYVWTDIIAIVNQYNHDVLRMIPAGWGMFNVCLMVGSIISHCSTVYILLRNADNLKDERDRRRLQVISFVAIANQLAFLICCGIAFVEVTYSTSLIVTTWTLDHIIFNLVNEYIKKFLNSQGHELEHTSDNARRGKGGKGDAVGSPRLSHVTDSDMDRPSVLLETINVQELCAQPKTPT